jgi:hypothetical protein
MTLVADWNSSVNVPFQRMRQQLLDGALQEGVIGASDLMVVQRGAGANQSVDVGAGFAWVQIDTGTRNGMGHVTNDAVANVTVTASNGTNPRIDQIILRWNDTSIPTGAGNVPTLEVLTGTATSGATLANRTGAAALPNDCLRLADLLIPTSSTTISNTQIRDRRPWARGVNAVLFRTSGDTAAVSSTSWGDIDATNLTRRFECSGVPLRIRLSGTISSSSTGGHFYAYSIDGDLTGSSLSPRNRLLSVVTATLYFVDFEWITTPAAGSHLISPLERAASGNAFFVAAGAGGANGGQLEFTVEEIVRPNTANNTTTSG